MTGQTVSVRPAPARALSAAQECAVLRAAATKGTVAPPARERLAALLNQLDQFEQTITLLEPLAPDERTHGELLLLTAALFARGGEGKFARALAAAHAAFGSAQTERQRGTALAEQARVLFRLDRPDEALAAAAEALDRDPHNVGASQRLLMHHLRNGDDRVALAAADKLAQRGAAHTQLTALRAVLLARTGQDEPARALLGLDRFLTVGRLEPPTGWPDLPRFNAALAAELLASPALRYGRHGTTSVRTWRIDALTAGAGPLALMLSAQIAETIQAHVAALDGTDHPWRTMRPDRLALRSWCVITEGNGHEDWHMHPDGWMSGVYYVQVPPEVSKGSGDAGCLALGLADTLVPQEDAARVGTVLVRPAPGLIATFPSHAYHRTFPHGAAGKRICVAFDLEAA